MFDNNHSALFTIKVSPAEEPPPAALADQDHDFWQDFNAAVEILMESVINAANGEPMLGAVRVLEEVIEQDGSGSYFRVRPE